MGATVLIAQAASTLRHTNGTLIYFLYERTHEQITSATECTWNCIAIGTYTQVLGKIFLHAGACEAGPLVGQHGTLTPEDYLHRWRQAMSRPAQQLNVTIDLSIDPSLYAGVPPEHVDAVANLLASAGHNTLAVALNHGSAQIELYHSLELVLNLFGTQGILPPWRALHYEPNTLQGECDVPPTTTSKPDVTPPMVYRIGETERLVKVGDGPWERWGWQQSTVARFITAEAHHIELAFPGTAAEAIKAFRLLCALAPSLPPTTKISVQRSVAQLPTWYEHSADNLAHQMAIAMDNEPAPDSYEVQYGAVVERDALYYLCSLSPLQVQWEVPQAPARGVSNGNGNGQGGAPHGAVKADHRH
ncbi:hypothetical protein [Duganella vulcania]|uniref:Uncharacterized protein n=1 Tax=Duganella vulcania TaxID=2692166 RepID=A0A845GEN2_9BURK|nr:hypothetical protein [Duganella vulcania]MYM92361.1 hypothetical protein [Duganella vulcania]